jgi:gas vesicle protein
MSYAGPAKPTPSARPTQVIKRVLPTPATTTDRNVAFTAGVVLGAALGAGVALLLAPRSGRSTRRRLVRSGRRLKQRGRDAWHDAWHDLGRELHDLRHRGHDDDEESATNGAQRKSFSRRAATSL